jgi:gliding motility-associated-like protein
MTKSLNLKIVTVIAIFMGSIFWANQTSVAQTVNANGSVKSNFGIDGDLYTDFLQFTSGTADGTDDFFKNDSLTAGGSGIPMIDDAGMAAFRSIIAGAGTLPARNLTQVNGMNGVKNSIINGRIVYDALFARDHFGINPTRDTSAMNGNFKNGSNITTWITGPVTLSTEDDLVDAGAVLRRQGPTHNDSLWFIGAASIMKVNEDNHYIDYELFAANASFSPGSGITNTGTNNGHTAWTFAPDGTPTQFGDVIFSFSSSNNGNTWTLSTRIWVNQSALPGGSFAAFNALANRPFNFTGTNTTGTGAAPFGYAAITPRFTSNAAFARMNLSAATLASPWGTLQGGSATFSNTYAQLQFGEVAVNLTALGLDIARYNSTDCYSFFGSILFKVRDGNAFDANIKDFAGPFPFGNTNVFEVNANGGIINCVSGNASLSVNSATPILTYSWTGPGSFTSSSATPSVTNAGTYNLRVTASGGCVAVDTAVVLGTPTIIISQVSSTKTCQGLSNGSLTVSASGGGAPYTYTWSGGGAGATKTGLAAGNHSVTAVDANGCSASSVFNVETHPAVLVALTSTNVFCQNQCAGNINVTLISGTSPVTYSWSNGATTQNLTNLCAGLYTLTVTDGNGCSIVTSKSITPYTTLVATVTARDVTYNGSDGEAHVVASGGLPPYSFLWSNGATTTSILNLTPGIYGITVTDANNDEVSEVAVVEPAGLVKTGSFIVNMGVTPQTIPNGLRPYGMIFDLVRNYNVPVKWVIRPGKQFDPMNGIVQADFTYNGVDYKGGPFIIDAEFRTAAVNSRIAYWQSQGVVGVTTTSDIDVPVYDIITTFGNVVIDQQNEGLVTPYFANAMIPSSIYNVGLPTNLGPCDDSYFMPHADPTWANHSNLRAFNINSRGFIWAGCHANSVLEGIFDPGNPSIRMNFLTTNGLQCFGGGRCGTLITETHGNPTKPFKYYANTGDRTIMQFIDDMTPSTENGSEQWYIPLTTGRWNPGATICVTTSDGAVPREGVKLAFGYGFDNPDNGLVMYEGGHTFHNKGTVQSAVAAQRAFLNFLFNSGIEKQLVLNANIPTNYISGVPRQVSVSVLSGSPPYTFQWTSTCGSGSAFANATAGTTTFSLGNVPPQFTCVITCVVTDACGRRNFISVPIASTTPPPDPVLISITNKVDALCFGSCDGTIDVTVNGGFPPYTYIWSSGATTQDLFNLCQGNYSITVRDSIGCETSETIVINHPAQIQISASNITPVSCNGGNNGSITTTITGGTPGYTFLWSNGATTQNIANLTAGTYFVTVTDNNNCTVVSSGITVSQPDVLAITIDGVSDATCFGYTDGAINITVTGGNIPYTYLWSTGSTASDLSGAGQGTYTVTVTDSKNCTATSGNILVGQPTQLTAAVNTITAVRCNGEANGSITLNVGGGTPAYSYLWSNSSTAADLMNVNAGAYSVTVTDANSCQAILNGLVVPQPGFLTATLTAVQNEICAGSASGSINITTTGGNPAYTFIWNNGATTEDLTGLSGGSYSVTVTDSKGCTATLSGITVSTTNCPPVAVDDYAGTGQGVPVTVDVVDNDYDTDGNIDPTTVVIIDQPNNGTATVDPITGEITYTPNPAFTGTDTLVYSVCDDGIPAPVLCDTALVIINIDNGPSISSVVTHVSCFGFSNGAINITVLTGASPFTFLWSPGGQTTEDLSGLPAGNYSVTVTDNNGSTITQSFIVTEPAALSLAGSSSTNVTCFGLQNASVTLVVSGGTTPYSYSWSNLATTQNLSGIGAGNYTVTVTDAKGCTVTQTFNITEPQPLVATGIITPVACAGNATGSIDLTITGGTTPYIIQWSTGATTEDISGLAAGTYHVYVTDARGCQYQAHFTITEILPMVLSAGITHATCGAANGQINLSIGGGVPAFTYLWSTNETTASITNLPYGSYSVTVTDSRSCTVTKTYGVDEVQTMVVTPTVTAAQCGGVNNGAITLTVTGSVGPFTYLWSNGLTTQNLSGVASGNYIVTVTNAAFCREVVVINVGSSSPITITPSVGNAACGLSNGSITLTVAGGTPAYTYFWSNGAITSTLSGVAAGIYSVTVTDAAGCSATRTVAVGNVNAPLVGGTVQHTTCGQNNGAIAFTYAGGTGPYQFHWSNGATTQNISGLGAGLYTVMLVDLGTGCSNSTTFVVNSATGIIVEADKRDVTCNGLGNGSIDVTVTGGSGSYTYLWSPGGQTTQDLNNLTGGNYSITALDANGCSAATNISITEQPAMSGSVIIVPVTCQGGNTGGIDLTLTGGTAPYTVYWSNGATTQDILGLTAGAYHVYVTDANGCTFQASYTVTVSSVMVLSAGITNASCGRNDGQINLSISGGFGPYTYFWSNGGLTANLNNLAFGSYTVTVTDSRNCTVSKTFAVDEVQPMIVTPTIAGAQCGGSNGSVTLAVTNGTAPYTFIWSHGVSTQNAIGLAAGTYIVTITDARQCNEVVVINVGGTSPVIITPTVIAANCNMSNGSIIISPSGGSTPYSYIWSTGASGDRLNNVPSGIYSVTVTDGNGCTATSIITVSDLGSQTVTGTVQHATCGQSDGSVNITVTGGVGPFTYLWSNGATTQNLSGLAAGTYIVEVTGSGGCSRFATFIVNSTNGIIVEADKHNVTCPGAANGRIDVTVTGGTGVYTFSWSNGATTQNLTNISGGNYSITAVDANGCSASTNIVITEPLPINATAQITNVTCQGGISGAIDLTVTGGTTPYTYNWNTGVTTQDISGLGTGIYLVTIRDSNNCMTTASFTVSAVSNMILSTGVTNATCGQNNAEATVSVAGGIGPYRYLWNNNATTQTISGLSPALYHVTVTDLLNCTATVPVLVDNVSDINISYVSTDVICGVQDGSIDITVTGGIPPYSYLWSNGALVPDLNFIPTGTYCVTVTDATGCTSALCVTVGQIPPMILAINRVDASCGTANGSATVTVLGGTPAYSYLWSTGITTAAATGLVAGTYAITVTDLNGCTVSSYVIIQNVNAPVLTLTAQGTTCGNNDGAVTLTYTGGVAPVTFLWSNGATTQNITALAQGTYGVTVTDANGCVAVGLTTVAASERIIMVADRYDVSCNGLQNGFIDVEVTGGTGIYTYLWSIGGQTTQDISSLATGVYTLTVFDAINGCTATTSVVIGEPQQISIISQVEPVLCAGGSNGAIVLGVSGGTPSYNYQWSNGATTQNVSGLPQGLYSVTITDSLGCTASTAISVVTQYNLLVSSAVTNASCGQNNGLINISVTGGSGSYTYLWSNSLTTTTISNLTAGVYTVTVNDAVGCSVVQNVLVSSSSGISVTGTVTNAQCLNPNTGVIITSVSGGAIPYTYLWSNSLTTSSISSLAPGNYIVTVTDKDGCIEIAQFTVSINGNLQINVNTTLAGCQTANGTATASTTGGSAPYSYVWSNGQTGTTATGLSVGVYSVTVTDALGCSGTQTFTVNSANQPTVTVNVLNNNCVNGSVGAIDITLTGGNPPFSFIWSNGATTEDIFGLNNGIYAVTVKDNSGCDVVAFGTVASPAALIVQADVTSIACNGDSTGAIGITVSNGTSPYTYIWNIGATTQNISGLGMGNYDLTVVDNKGCLVSTTTTISEPAPILTTADSITQPSCNGANDGSLFVSVTGGLAPYAYFWSNGATTEDLLNVPAGNYSLVVVDAKLCVSDSFRFTVNQPDRIIVSVTSTNSTTCYGSSDGGIDITVSGGMPGYTYLWNNNDTTEDIFNIPAGTYSVIVTDAVGCTGTLSGITVGQPDSIRIVADRITGITCLGSGMGTIDISVTGGSGNYSYLWSNNDTTQDISVSFGGIYTVTVYDSNDCFASASFTVTEARNLDLSGTETKSPTCIDIHDGRITIVVDGGTPPYTYMWSDSVTGAVRDSLSVGTYSVTVTDVNGCTHTSSFTLDGNVCNLPPDAVNDTVTAGQSTTIKIPVLNNDSDPDGDNIYVVTITNQPDHGTAVINPDGTISYTPDDGFVGVDSFTYQICDDGIPPLCDTAVVYITVMPERPNIFIPNGFSPNGDPYNEYWEIVDISKYPKNEVIIFNRWGNKVYEAKPYQNEWQGVNYKGEDLPDGTYYYVLKLNDDNDTVYTGFVVINRGN